MSVAKVLINFDIVCEQSLMTINFFIAQTDNISHVFSPFKTQLGDAQSQWFFSDSLDSHFHVINKSISWLVKPLRLELPHLSSIKGLPMGAACKLWDISDLPILVRTISIVLNYTISIYVDVFF